MSMSTVSAITQREVREMMNDWRIMVPIFLLSFLLPLMLVGASGRVIRFVEDDALAARLVPFAILIVGFIPSSFSLITALESFVGERERNSLEALLSMPISDRELYLGKLFSSLITPLVSSYVAMLMFSFLMYTIDTSLVPGGINLTNVSLLILLFITIGCVAVTMVAGAVIISSHISSIRAANLMSSFILLPMALVIQFQAFLIINSRWDVLSISVLALMVLALLLVRFGLLTFNREEILSRENQRASDTSLGKLLAKLTIPKAQIHTATNQHPAVAIARRELRDSLTDWRVLAPSFVLTFIIPLALVAGTDFAVNFVGDAELVARLVPFAILLVGFIPATFSLIVALDSFVGERERNSLEALLSMPISDSHLYLSKLVSSCISPLLTCWSAMLVFALATSRIHPALYHYAMTPIILLQLVIMISIMTVLMVAGAVVISSHTSTIRAANLLASFVLLPVAVTIQLQALLIISRRWEVMWFVVLALIVVAMGLIRTGMAAFNREEILSREHEQFNFEVVKQNLARFFREYHPAGVSPDTYRGDPFSPRRFYTREFLPLLRELRLPLAMSLLAAMLGILTGWYIADDFRLIGDLQEGADTVIASVGQPPLPRSSPWLALGIFANNIRVSLLSNIFSTFALGVFAFMVPFVAFTQIGFVSFKLAGLGGSWVSMGADSPLQFIVAYVLPHGIIELPTFILGAALGIRIGASLMSPPAPFTVGQNLLWAIGNFFKVWLLVLLPLTLLASLVEGLITPLVLHALY